MKSIRNRILSAVGTIALCFAMIPTDAFGYWTNGFEVYVNGQSIGIVENELEVSSALAVVNYQLTSAYDETEAIKPDIQLRAKLVTDEKLLDKNSLHDYIASCSDKMVPSTTITVDGADTVSVADSDAVSESISLVTDALSHKNGTSSIIEMIGSYDQLVPENTIVSAEDASNYFIDKQLLTVYTVLSSEKTESYTPAPEEYYDDNLYEGVKATTYQGVRGSAKVVTSSSYINGELVDTQENKEIVDYGTPAKVAVGTKPRPVGIGTGKFSMPTSGTLTSPFGMRWGRMHNGIDLAAPVGTPIYASDDGVVIASEYKGSFGNLVIIDHQNGFTTYYAHNSKNLVSVGDKIKAGDLIAKMGSTGRSTGSHLHFEIRYNDVPQNPQNYL